ncbi:MAG: hypothetical protein AB7E41_00750 [Mycolicibacterium sp.]
MMPYAALGLFVVLMLVIGAWRRRIQLARTGDSGNRRRWHPDGTSEWWALAIADVGYLLVGVGAPAAALVGLPALGLLDRAWVHGVGIVVAVAGIPRRCWPSWGWGRRGGSASTRPRPPSWSPPGRSGSCATRSSPHCWAP